MFDAQLYETVQNLGGRWRSKLTDLIKDWGGRMRWRVVVELSGTDGVVHLHEVHLGENSLNAGSSPVTLGLALGEAKAVLSNLQRHLVQMQTEEDLSGTTALPEVRSATTAEGSPTTAIAVIVWRDRGSRSSIRSVPV